MSELTLGQLVIDAADPQLLATFYSQLLDRPIEPGGNQYMAQLAGANGVPHLMFLAVPESRTGKNRLHIDFVSADFRATADRAVTLGATEVGQFEEYGTAWVTLADPEGNVFDIGRPH
ncbi:VOC family protein [Microlunatus speluncae]|uniref:VOC family protein n=1 Tax=Microlunatus speluncae TaxID=2594267 RepID=UPI001266426A|nr:VOC family protein [Microlunatus speluncae]